MAFPTTVDSGYAPGIEGDKYGLNSVTGMADIVPLSSGGLVRVASFVWRSDTDLDDGRIVQAQATPLSDERPWGFVMRNIIFPNPGLGWIGNPEGTLMVPDGFGLNVAISGSFWARSATDATVGQKVFAHTNPTNVSETPRISTGAAGDDIADAIETNWTVLRGGAAEGLIVISNRLET